MDLTKQSVVDIHFKAIVGFLPVGAAAAAGPPAVSEIRPGFRAFKAMLLEGAGGRMRVIDAPIKICKTIRSISDK